MEMKFERKKAINIILNHKIKIKLTPMKVPDIGDSLYVIFSSSVLNLLFCFVLWRANKILHLCIPMFLAIVSCQSF